MRPDILTMQAFGPYARKEIIDFGALGERTMFVISGKTGAGKTTIFDGISFAIYGKASGEDRSGQDLRSQFADEDVLTEVTLQFTLKEKTYLVIRSPQQERKKKSGEGTTTVGAKAELYELSPEGKKLLGANIREVDDKIKSLIGLDANQFRQILMIPQNEFRKLLTSDSKDKEQILQRLFHTELYKRIEEKLKEEAASLKKQSEKTAQRRIELLKGIKAAGHQELQEKLAADEPNELEIVPLLQTSIKDAGAMYSELGIQIKEKQAVRDRINQEISTAADLLKRFSEKDRLENEKMALEKKKGQIEQLQEEIKMAHKAASLEKQEQYYLRIGRKLKESETEFESMGKQVDALSSERIQRQQDYDGQMNKADERELAARNVHKLQQVKDSVMAYAALKAQVLSDERNLKAAKDKLEKTVKELAEAENTAEKISAEKMEAEKATFLYSEKEHELERTQLLAEKVKKIRDVLLEKEAAGKKLQDKKSQLAIVQEALVKEKQVLEHLNEDWRASQAGLLATLLREGENCPVCGSLSHPSPAQKHENTPSDLQLKQQEKTVQDAETKKSLAESEYYQSESKYRSLNDSITEKLEDIQRDIPSFSLTELDKYLVQFDTKCRELKEILQDLSQRKKLAEQLENQLARLKEQMTLLKDSKTQLEKAEDESKSRYIETTTKLAGLTDTLPEGIRTEEDYNQALESAFRIQEQLHAAMEQAQHSLQKVKEKEAAAIAKKESLTANIASLNKELTSEREKFKTEMNSQGFNSYKDYVAAKKTEAELEMAENQVKEYTQSWQSVISLFHDLELKLKDVPKPDIEGLKKTFEYIDRELEELRQKQNQIQAEKQANEEIDRKLKKLREEVKSLDEQYSIVGHLSEISKGQNPFRITFERYVLAAFLDDILKEANLRLLKMTSGRYQLLRKLDPTRRNIQSGLELSVYDQYTGQERHVKTLSGGESFKASLALALGLADVVQQNAGGISLETMFIDEGFGTLDPESLDQAIEALMEIQSTGRMVGIISHVPELKERIDAQLQVTSTQNGSKTSFYFAG